MADQHRHAFGRHANHTGRLHLEGQAHDSLAMGLGGELVEARIAILGGLTAGHARVDQPVDLAMGILDDQRPRPAEGDDLGALDRRGDGERRAGHKGQP